MHTSRLSAVPLIFAAALAFGACENAPPTSPASGSDVAFNVNGGTTSEQCTVVDFTSFAHGDPVTALTVNTVPLTLSAVRFDGLVSVDPTAYDVELTGADLAALDATHDDTQAERDCNPDCVGLGRTLVVPDENFATGGDNTEGGSITITGFGADPDPTAVWEVTDFDVVDGDPAQGATTLYVDDVQTAQSTKTGNATVEDVSVPSNTINTDIEFQIGDQQTDASSAIDNIRLCRTTTQGGEGCTPGYWKQPHHFDSWTTYDPTDLYCDVFGVGPCITLLEALEAKGGGESALLRHSVAALLNAASADVSYDVFVADLISAVQDAYATDTKQAFNALKDELEGFNEQNCPLN